ncbi:hypothetical protein ABPG72_016690 [Tetrahymena utriculariae]
MNLITMIKNLDLFSSNFQFSMESNQLKKRTLFGVLLSLLVLSIAFCYFILPNVFVYQQLNIAIIQTQSFIQGDISVTLNSNLVGFRYLYNFNISLDVVQTSTNTTYLVFVPYFQYLNYDCYELIPLDIIGCQDTQLDGFNCLDFSKIQNYTLISAQNNRI